MKNKDVTLPDQRQLRLLPSSADPLEPGDETRSWKRVSNHGSSLPMQTEADAFISREATKHARYGDGPLPGA
jgi:hypothetical protein